jgi:hypothetical protein
MKQQHIDRIKKMVSDVGISQSLKQLGGDKDIIRQVYIDNPESYLDVLIGNLYPIKDGVGNTRWSYQYKRDILRYEDNSNEIDIDDYIWNFFYKSIMQFDDNKIETIFTKWLYKHYPKLSERKPKPVNDLEWCMKMNSNYYIYDINQDLLIY